MLETYYIPRAWTSYKFDSWLVYVILLPYMSLYVR
jgi:hypothetical protein